MGRTKITANKDSATFEKNWWFWAIMVVAALLFFVVFWGDLMGHNEASNDTSTDSQNSGSRKTSIEDRLDPVDALTACEVYGKRQYSGFNIHVISGKIAERAVDEKTWFFKYRADADGRQNLNMECYVTGTSSSPIVTDFTVY